MFVRQHKFNFAQLATESWAILPGLQTQWRCDPTGDNKHSDEAVSAVPFYSYRFHDHIWGHIWYTDKTKDFEISQEQDKHPSSAPWTFRYCNEVFGRKTSVAFFSKQLIFDKCSRIDLCCVSLNWVTMYNPPWNRTFTFHWPTWKKCVNFNLCKILPIEEWEKRGDVLFAVLAFLELEEKSGFLIRIFENAEVFSMGGLFMLIQAQLSYLPF